MEKIADIKNEVQYAGNSVVSNTLISKGGGTVTLFAFDAGQGLSEHTAPFDALVQIVDGSAEISIGGEVHNVKAGEFVIMPSGVPHSLKAPEKFKMLLVMVKQ